MVHMARELVSTFVTNTSLMFLKTYLKNENLPYERSFFPLQKIRRVLGVSNLQFHDFPDFELCVAMGAHVNINCATIQTRERFQMPRWP